ncbi:MAG: nickel pincer cofactor biosynthesis protein LarB [Selenomonas sp.]|nr:nickel pincer cofactor biosynthesis protein LarB [Selenomonas sp.]
MTEQDIAVLLRRYKDGGLSEEEAVQAMRSASFEDMGFAEVDHSREQRQGFPEVIYAEGKTQEQVLAILQSLAAHGKGNLMATRASREKYDFVKAAMPDVEYDEAARIIYVDRDMSVERDPEHRVLILTAGTSDIPVAEEARLTAYLWGNTVDTCYDCGVAGIHRLFAHMSAIRTANVIIVIAGMEGALASVVGGLTDRPVIAVPTSIGYGASFHGLAALLSMLNSCSSGVSVVNIDNGFGAGVLASKINHMR